MRHPSVLGAEEHSCCTLWLQLRRLSLPVVAVSIHPSQCVCGRQRDKVCILKHNRSVAVVTSCEGSSACPKIKSTLRKDGWLGGKSMDRNAFSLFILLPFKVLSLTEAAVISSHSSLTLSHPSWFFNLSETLCCVTSLSGCQAQTPYSARHASSLSPLHDQADLLVVVVCLSVCLRRTDSDCKQRMNEGQHLPGCHEQLKRYSTCRRVTQSVKLNQSSTGMKPKLLCKAFAGRQTKGHEILGSLDILMLHSPSSGI